MWMIFFFCVSSRRRHTRSLRDWSSDVCSSDLLAAWRGHEREAAEVIEATMEAATARGLGMLVDFADHASSVLYNGLGRHDAAREAARRAFEHDQLGLGPDRKS